MLVVGLARRRGDYQGVAYDNMMIYCTRPANPQKDETGEITECFKIKFENFPEIIQVGVQIEPVYDRFGRVVDIRIV